MSDHAHHSATPGRRARAGVLRPRPGRAGVAAAGLAAAAVALAACSSSPSASSATTAPSNTGTGNTGAGTNASAASATATVKAGSTSAGTVLENSSGMPLYTYGPDGTGTTSQCSGACLQAWPPLTVPAGTTPTAASGVTGTLGTAKQADGSEQVTYNGHLLYTFLSDTPGNATGNGVAKFTVAKVTAGASPTGKTSSSGTPSTSPPTTKAPSSSGSSGDTGGGYQY